MKGYTEQVKGVISGMTFNALFYAKALWEAKLTDIPEKTYYKVLERLVNSEELVHLTKGLYYRPYKEDGKIVPISREEILSYYTEDFGGVVIGEVLYEKAGIIDRKSEKTEVISERIPDMQKTVGDVVIYKAGVDLNEDTIAVIETMEILQNYHKIENPRNGHLLAYMKHFAEKYDEKSTELVLEKRKYKKSTIAFLKEILDWYNVKHSLDRHLSSLSKYRIPAIEELRQDTPDYVVTALDVYIERVRYIYGDCLKRILLYGSYARGDFTEESDIDVMILLDMPELEIKKYRHALSEVTYEMNSELEIEINPIAKDEKEFLKWVEVYPFYANIKREGVELFGAT